MSTNTGNSIIPSADAEHDAHYCTQSCDKCAEILDDDIELDAENEAGDGLCRACRFAEEARMREQLCADWLEACEQRRGKSVADWFGIVIDACLWPIVTPSTVPFALLFADGYKSLELEFEDDMKVTVSKVNRHYQTQPDWQAAFSLSTPLSLIKTALSHK